MFKEKSNGKERKVTQKINKQNKISAEKIVYANKSWQQHKFFVKLKISKTETADVHRVGIAAMEIVMTTMTMKEKNVTAAAVTQFIYFHPTLLSHKPM